MSRAGCVYTRKAGGWCSRSQTRNQSHPTEATTQLSTFFSAADVPVPLQLIPPTSRFRKGRSHFAETSNETPPCLAVPAIRRIFQSTRESRFFKSPKWPFTSICPMSYTVRISPGTGSHLPVFSFCSPTGTRVLVGRMTMAVLSLGAGVVADGAPAQLPVTKHWRNKNRPRS